MSIKKCIMNYFDKATNAMVPFHPQTESGAITDWHESIIGSLASKVLPTVVSELTTDSVMGKLMKMLLNASGVKYSIDTNGYVCLGSFFGGLIIQWGSSTYGSITFPLAFSIWNRMYGGYSGGSNRLIRFQDKTRTGFKLQVYDVDSKTLNGDSSYDGMWLAVGV